MKADLGTESPPDRRRIARSAFGATGWPALILALCLIYLAPTFGRYGWTGHEGYAPQERVTAMSEVWRAQGPFHVPWLPQVAHGYGWPFFTFYAPLGYYVAATMVVGLGSGTGPATRMSFYLAFVLSGIAAYGFGLLLGRRYGSPRPRAWAFVAAVVYGLNPYHLTDLFVRVSLAECWAWATLGGAFVALEWSRGGGAGRQLLVAPAYALLVLSHNALALFGTILIALYAVLTASSVRWLLSVAGSALLGLALSAYFWYPALALRGLVDAGDASWMTGGARALHGHSLYPIQFFMEAYGRGLSLGGVERDFAVNPGLALMTGALLAAVALIRPGLGRAARYRLGVLLALFALSLLMVSRWMPWGRVPELFLYIQFPWRLLILTAWFGAAATALAGPVVARWIHPLVLAALAVALSLPPARTGLIEGPPADLPDPEGTIGVWTEAKGPLDGFIGSVIREYRPVASHYALVTPTFWEAYPAPPHRLTLVEGSLTLLEHSRRGTRYRWRYQAAPAARARVHAFYFPGWSFALDGRRAPEAIRPDADGLIELALPAGEHLAELRYEHSPPGRRGLAVSYGAWGFWAFAGLVALSRGRFRSSAPAGAAEGPSRQ